LEINQNIYLPRITTLRAELLSCVVFIWITKPSLS